MKVPNRCCALRETVDGTPRVPGAPGKSGHRDRSPGCVHEEVLDLLIELEASEDQLDAPVVYASGRNGVATMDPAEVPATSCGWRSSIPGTARSVR